MENKLTFQVMKEIKTLATSLPKTPKFLLGEDNQMHIEMKSTNVKVTGKQLLKKNPKAIMNGKPADKNSTYTWTEDQVVYLNHKENLIDAYKKAGKPAMDYYAAAVHETVKTLLQPKSQVIIETYEKKFSLEEETTPVPDEIIYSGPIEEVNKFVLNRAGMNIEDFLKKVASRPSNHNHVLIYILQPKQPLKLE